ADETAGRNPAVSSFVGLARPGRASPGWKCVERPAPAGAARLDDLAVALQPPDLTGDALLVHVGVRARDGVDNRRRAARSAVRERVQDRHALRHRLLGAL